MTDSQFNYLSMTEADLAILNENMPIIAGNKLSAAVAAVITTHAEILSIAGLQSQINKGPTTTKNILWKNAATIADHVCSGVRAYADDINDANLSAAMHFTFKGLLKCSTNQAVLDMQTIHDKAAAIPIASLLLFNVVASDIPALQTAIGAFSAAAPMKRAMVVDTSVATTQLPILFTLQRKQFKKLDNIISTFRASQPTFVEAHFNARKIINYGKTQQAEELILMPQGFEAIFGKKFIEGDTFTVRNHSAVPIEVFLTDTPGTLPTANIVKILANTDMKLEVSKDFGGVFGHWLLVFNPNTLDDIHVTVILAHGKSHSSAASPVNIAPPKPGTT